MWKEYIPSPFLLWKKWGSTILLKISARRSKHVNTYIHAYVHMLLCKVTRRIHFSFVLEKHSVNNIDDYHQYYRKTCHSKCFVKQFLKWRRRVNVTTQMSSAPYHKQELHWSSTTHSEASLGLLIFSLGCLRGKA